MGDRIAVMSEGLLQQVATPGEVYDHPANLFVAGFIGSPTMNLVPVQVIGGRAKASGVEVALPTGVPQEKAVLGFRPEAFRVDANGDNVIDMAVEVVERLGSDQYLYGRAGGDALTARVEPGFKVNAGDRVRLGVDAHHLHVFDEATQKALP